MARDEICGLCEGKLKLIRKDFTRSKTPTRPMVDVKNVACFECENCGEIIFNADQARVYEQETVEQERRALNLLTSSEIREILELFDPISRNHLEKILGINPRSFYRWENSLAIQSTSADVVLRLLRFAPDLLKKLAREKNISLRPRMGRPRAAAS